ncbi:hypothetical protein KA977_14355 [Candidatus Dependentiae bacterium]|nr:hypothetical protein [Candidatus Dependentiae bacterium]
MNDFKIRILGDSGPFSITGRSISYLVECGNSSYLIDCGAPVFQLLPFNKICDLKGIIVTHSHDDHKRWFTDTVLFRKYVTPTKPKIKLVTIESLQNEFRNSSKYALEKTLSFDSRKVIEVPYTDFYEPVRIGPVSKYSIKEFIIDGKLEYRVVDESGEIVSPEKSKVIIHPVTGSKNILFYAENYKSWVNPEIFYSFEDTGFYAENKFYEDSDSGIKIFAVNSPAWHGIVSTAYIIEHNGIKVYFSGDTVYNVDLWKELTNKKIIPKYNINDKEYIKSYVLTGDINDFIEISWSKERYESALKIYSDSNFILHDSAGMKSVVHTDFSDCSTFDKSKTLLTHSPDRYASKIPLTFSDKEYILKSEKLYEITKDGLFELNADIFYKNNNRYFAGYKNESGKFGLLIKNGILELKPVSELSENEKCVEIYELFEDIKGGYYSADDKLTEKYVCLSGIIYEISNENNGEKKLTPSKNLRR